MTDKERLHKCNGINCPIIIDLDITDPFTSYIDERLYCSSDCRENTEPYGKPTTGRAATTSGGSSQARRGAEIRWQHTQGDIIALHELKTALNNENKINELRNALLRIAKGDKLKKKIENATPGGLWAIYCHYRSWVAQLKAKKTGK